MSKFHLNIQELVQGELILNKVNVAFVFQVNCPGCFIYGIPLINNLYRSFSNKVGFATAFEDFEYNNEESLKMLSDDGSLVGETKKYYNTNYGLTNYSEKIDFPVAFDRLVSSEEFINSDKIEAMCNAIPDFSAFSEKEKEIVYLKIKSHYSHVPIIAETFTMNQLRGTPSFVIFDDQFTILEQYFGHIDENFFKSRITELLN